MRIPYLVRGSAAKEILKVFPKPKEIIQPLIKVVVECQGAKLKLFALVDSGADSCLFPRDVADILGINLKSGSRIFYTGIGGSRVPFYFHEVRIFIGKYQFQTMAGFADSAIGTSALLGQRGFFENFVVTFDYKNRFIDICKSGLIRSIASRLLPS